ncbi:MAG: hypothetical protein JO218_15740 [Burkholderiales bacterium]|nr:hypothetical protein [Burkholderiales bacterium]
MSKAKTPIHRGTNSEPDSLVSLSSLMKEPPSTREQHLQRMAKRGDVRRQLEDLMLARENRDLW